MVIIGYKHSSLKMSTGFFFEVLVPCNILVAYVTSAQSLCLFPPIIFGSEETRGGTEIADPSF